MRFFSSKATQFLIMAFTLSLMLVSIETNMSRSFAGSTNQSSSTSTGGVFDDQPYSGVLTGGELYTNNSFPFQRYISNSTILALTQVRAWLYSSGYSVTDLRPYLSLYPSEGNPYDFSQAIASANGTIYYIYEYLVTGSADNLVIGVWVADNPSHTVAKIFTWDNSSEALFTSENSENGVGQEVYDNQLSGNDAMYGAVDESSVFSDLSDPSSCGDVCWAWGNWIGSSNYDWYGSEPSDGYFFQAVLAYWGGNDGQPTNCGTSDYTANCIVFQYSLDDGSLQSYPPGYGSWPSGDSVTMEWAYANSNCVGQSQIADNTVTETITDTTNSYSTSYSECMPNITYSQLLEERPLVGGYLAQNPEFGTHDFTGYLLNGGGDLQLSDANNRWNIQLVDEEGSTLVAASANSNHGTYSTWTDTWDSSTYP